MSYGQWRVVSRDTAPSPTPTRMGPATVHGHARIVYIPRFAFLLLLLRGKAHRLWYMAVRTKERAASNMSVNVLLYLPFGTYACSMVRVVSDHGQRLHAAWWVSSRFGGKAPLWAGGAWERRGLWLTWSDYEVVWLYHLGLVIGL
jgi:hypothetical protein